MTQALRKLTFEEYASLDAEGWTKLGLPEGRCEYVDGGLVELMPEGEENDWIADYLFHLLLLANINEIPLTNLSSTQVGAFLSFG